MAKITLHRFYFDSAMLARANEWRYGQAMFNNLVNVRPDLAEQVRATDKDPFYVSNLDHPNWDRFVDFIEENWYKSETPAQEYSDFDLQIKVD